jgi:cytochrome b-561
MPVKSGASFQLAALPVLLMAQLLAAAVLALTLVWVLRFRGGVSWELSSNPQLVYTVKLLYF